MKTALSFILLLSVCSICFAQTTTKLEDRCPQLDISSDTPSDYKLPITYELILKDGEQKGNLKFVWIVEKFGRIVSGQGTKKINAETKPEDRYQGLTATVRIYGLPSGCPDAASVAATIAALTFKENISVKKEGD